MDLQTLQTLGFSIEQLQQRVVDQICDTLLSNRHEDEDGESSFYGASEFKRKLDAEIKKRINETIDALAEKHVLPNVTEYVENLTIQQTNEWGEKRGESITFIEYLIQRAQAYMQEKVNYEGRSKTESDGYSWNGKQTRITFLIEKHLHHSIEKAMKESLSIATGEIAKGIHETTRLKLNEIAASLKVGVSL
jgi:hypothetical protein